MGGFRAAQPQMETRGGAVVMRVCGLPRGKERKRKKHCKDRFKRTLVSGVLSRLRYRRRTRMLRNGYVEIILYICIVFKGKWGEEQEAVVNLD